MLKELAENRAHGNVVRNPLDAGLKAADAAHEAVHLDTRDRGFIKQPDHIGVNKLIALQHNTAIPLTLMAFNLSADSALDSASHAGRRNKEPAIVIADGVSGHHVEEVRHIGADILRRREKAKVGVVLRGAGVVVAGADMNVGADAARFLTDHEAELGMHFEPHEAVNHVHALALHFFRPVDVPLFVETGLQFHHGGNLLPALTRFHQRLHDRGVIAHAVKRHLDTQHCGVLGRLLHQIHD